MILKSIEYSEYENEKNAWFLEVFALGDINLVVGRNSTGKTRTINVIKSLANLVSGDQRPLFPTGTFEAKFEMGQGETLEYKLKFLNSLVEFEQLVVSGEKKLDRGKEGKGNIFAVQLKQFMEFQTPPSELACVARRDSVQHPFFESLFLWGKSMRHYLFGTQLGQDMLAVFVKGKPSENLEEINLKEYNRVTGMLRKGIQKYGNEFKTILLNEMKFIGYELDDIGVAPAPGFQFQPNIGSELEAIYINEKGLSFPLFQNVLSQGMFRALSLLINVNFSLKESHPSCILIDDVGEGLDHERSASLIKLLTNKVEQSSIQLIMSTNDRFVMNNVPIEYWCVIQRMGSRCKVFTYENSKKIFDDFKFTGLNNFDFLSTDFYLKGFIKE